MGSVIEGKVAQILDEFTLILNVGRAQGVKEGMEFVIFAPGEEVTDPDTGESLGQWEMVKGHVVATHVQEKLCLCSAVQPRQEEDHTDPRTRTLSAALIAEHMPGQESLRPLNVNKSQIHGKPKAGPISVGDRARSVK